MSHSARQLAQCFLEIAPAALHWLRSAGRAHGEELPGVTIGQWRCLHMLEGQQHSLRELAARYGVSAPTMSRMISSMVERGWVSRAEAPGDRRQLVIKLLPPGERAMRDLHAEALNHLAELLEALTPEEREALAAGLTGLSRAVQQAQVHSPRA
jgi:DNA-binding MarR family transcriptional regulator